jgi:hypothetical protein
MDKGERALLMPKRPRLARAKCKVANRCRVGPRRAGCLFGCGLEPLHGERDVSKAPP